MADWWGAGAWGDGVRRESPIENRPSKIDTGRSLWYAWTAAGEPCVRIFYGWIIVAVSFFAWAISTGPRQTYAIFLLSFADEFGWRRALAAGAFSIHMAFYAVGGLLVGIGVDRLGPRRVMAWATGAWALTLLLCSRVDSLWHLYLVFGFLGGLATAGLAYVPSNALLARWFVRRRGLAAGLSQSGVPLGGAVFLPLTELAIAAVGWRRTYLGFGLLVGAAALPAILLFLRDDPRSLGLHPDGLPPAALPGREAAQPPPRPGPLAGAGLPKGFWTVFGANLLRGLALHGLQVHQVAALVDAGYGRMAAASFFALSSLLAGVGGLAAGGISDRLGRARTYAAMAALFVVGLAALLLVRSPHQVGLVFVFVLASGLAAGSFGPVFAALLTDRLHGPRFGFLVGLQNIAFGGGATLGPWLVGILYDRSGSYAGPLLLLAAACSTSAAIVAAAAPPARTVPR